MNKRQEQILEFVNQFKAEKGMAPTLQEIGVFVGIAPPSVLYNLQRMQAEGVIQRTDGVRGITTQAGEIACTAKQVATIQAIRDLQAAGLKPTLASISNRMGIGEVTVREHLIRMEIKGLVTRNPIALTAATQAAQGHQAAALQEVGAN